MAIGGGYALQHEAASKLPPLTLRRPLHSLGLLARHRRWAVGFLLGVAGWVLYVVALRLAPLSLVQAASAGGIGVLALRGRLGPAERLGVGAALGGLVLLALTLGAHAPTGRGTIVGVAVWIAVSAGVAGGAALLRTAPALGAAAGVLYAAGDVGTKAAVHGGTRLVFVRAARVPRLAFVCLQLAFQRGAALASAGLAVLWTNTLPIVAGAVLFSESLPGGWRGDARIAAFALVLVGAVALSRSQAPDGSAPSAASTGPPSSTAQSSGPRIDGVHVRHVRCLELAVELDVLVEKRRIAATHIEAEERRIDAELPRERPHLVVHACARVRGLGTEIEDLRPGRIGWLEISAPRLDDGELGGMAEAEAGRAVTAGGDADDRAPGPVRDRPVVRVDPTRQLQRERGRPVVSGPQSVVLRIAMLLTRPLWHDEDRRLCSPARAHGRPTTRSRTPSARPAGRGGSRRPGIASRSPRSRGGSWIR